jgi:hypothetical protein
MPPILGEPTRVSLAPHGLDQIRATFGDIFQYILSDHTLDPRWQSEFLTRVQLQVTCHKLIADAFSSVLDDVQRAGLQPQLASFGGCFAFRPQRTGTKLSTHSWGIAIDLNPETNEQGTAGTMDAGVIAIFQQAGFSWGGDWQGRSRDPMHFQFCSGY